MQMSMSVQSHVYTDVKLSIRTKQLFQWYKWCKQVVTVEKAKRNSWQVWHHANASTWLLNTLPYPPLLLLKLMPCSSAAKTLQFLRL